MITTNLFVIANVKQLRTGGSFRILLPFFRTSWGVRFLNSAIFNSFHNRVEFGTILKGLRDFWEWGLNPLPGTPMFVNVCRRWKCMHTVKIPVLYCPLFRRLERFRVQDVDGVYGTRGKVLPLHVCRRVWAVVQFHAFVTSSLGGEWSASCYGRSTARNTIHCSHRIRPLAPQSRSGRHGKKKNSIFRRELKSDFTTSQFLAYSIVIQRLRLYHM